MSAVSGSVPEEPLKLREVRRESAVERVGTAAEEDILEPEALENLERFQPDIAPVRSPFSIESEESKKAAERCFHVKKREVTERDTQAQKSRGKRDYQSPKQLFIRSESVQKQVTEGVLAGAGLSMSAEEYDAAVAAGSIPDETAAQISAAKPRTQTNR